VKLNLGKNL